MSGGNGERIDLPSGLSIYYVDENHSYWRCKGDLTRGKRLLGATTALKPLDFKPDGLMRWAARKNGTGIAMLASEGLSLEDVEDMRSALSWLNSAEGIWSALTEAELTYEDIRDAAATTGTRIHEQVLGALCAGEKVPSLAELPPEERGYGQAMLAFWRDHDPTPLQVEQVVADEEIGVAGRFDFRGELATHEGICLIDAKTGSGFIPVANHAQLALYDYLAECSGIGVSDQLLILKLVEDGSYELLEAQATHADALAAVDLYRRAGRIGNLARKAREKAAK